MARGQQASEGGAQALTEQESRKDMAMTSAGRCAARTRGGVAGRLRLLASGEVWRATLYLLLNWVSGTFWLAALFTLVSLGIGLAYTVVGLLILALTMRLWMAGASLERRRTAALLGTRIASPYRPPPERGLMNRALSRAGDPAVWRDLLYLVLLFPLGTVEGALVALAWSSLLFCLGAVVYLPYQALSSGAFTSHPNASPAGRGSLVRPLRNSYYLPGVMDAHSSTCSTSCCRLASPAAGAWSQHRSAETRFGNISSLFLVSAGKLVSATFPRYSAFQLRARSGSRIAASYRGITARSPC